MFLAIDIGNTTSSFGLFNDRQYLNGFKLETSKTIHEGELGKLIHSHLKLKIPYQEVIKRIGISSVVPEITQRYIEISQKYLKVIPEQLSPDIDYGFKIGYEEPNQLGSDRLANVIAVRELYGYPAMVIDMGTATKIELINAVGDYIGGMISPGMRISADALFEKTSRLYPVTISKPKSLIGTNTTDCLKAGIYYGFLGQLTAVIDNIKSQFGIYDIKVIGTGGLISIFEAEPQLFTKIDPELTMRGLQVALDQ